MRTSNLIDNTTAPRSSQDAQLRQQYEESLADDLNDHDEYDALDYLTDAEIGDGLDFPSTNQTKKENHK